MTGEETFEFAAAIAGVSIGLTAALLLAVLAVIGTWRLFRQATEAQQAAMKASVIVEDLARRIGSHAPPLGDGAEAADLQRQLGRLITQQQQLQERSRSLLETASDESPGPVALEELESAVNRLDTTVGQMATSLANLIRAMERQQEHP